EEGIRDWSVTGVQTCALPIFLVGRAVEVAVGNAVRLAGIAGQARLVQGEHREAVDQIVVAPVERAAAVYPVVEGEAIEQVNGLEIGRASCRERGYDSGVGG